MNKKILIMSPLLFTELAQADSLDNKVEEVKNNGFNVEYETIVKKVDSKEVYESEIENNKVREDYEINRIDNLVNEFYQKLRINELAKKLSENKQNEIKKLIEQITSENNKILEKFKADNLEITTRNEKIEADYNKSVENLNAEYAKKLEQYEKEVNEVNEYNKRQVETRKQARLDYEANKEKLKADYETEKAKINAENARLKTEHDKKVQELEAKYNDEISEWVSKNKAIEIENAKIKKDNEDKKKAYESLLADYNAAKTQNESNTTDSKLKKDEYDKKLAEVKAQNAEIEARNNKKLSDYEAEKKRVEAENEKIKASNEEKKKQAQSNHETNASNINEQNKQIVARNAEKERQYQEALTRYNQELNAYNNEKTSFDNKQVLFDEAGLKFSGDANRNAIGTKEYYAGYNLLVNKNVDVVKGSLGWTHETKIKDLFGGMTYRAKDPQGEIVWPEGTRHAGKRFYQYTLNNLREGSGFTLTNVGRTVSGKTINMKFTMKQDYVNPSRHKSFDGIESSILVEPGNNFTPNSAPNAKGSIGISTVNMSDIEAHVDFIDDDGNPINLALLSMNTDVDYFQSFGYKFTGENSYTRNIVPNDADLVKYNFNGVDSYLYPHDSGLSDFESIPKGSFLTYGNGTGFDFIFTNASEYYRDYPELADMAYRSGMRNSQNYTRDRTNLNNAEHQSRFNWADVGGYFSMFGKSSETVKIINKPVEPTRPVMEDPLGAPSNPSELVELTPLLDEPTRPSLETPLELPKAPSEENVVLPEKPIEPIYEKTKELLEKPVKKDLPELVLKAYPKEPTALDFVEKEVPDKPLPEKPVKAELPKKPDLEKLIEQPKLKEVPKVPEVDNVIQNLEKPKIKVKKFVYEYENSVGVTSLTLRNLK